MTRSSERRSPTIITISKTYALQISTGHHFHLGQLFGEWTIEHVRPFIPISIQRNSVEWTKCL